MKTMTQALSPDLELIRSRLDIIPFCEANVVSMSPGGWVEWDGGTDVDWDDQEHMNVGEVTMRCGQALKDLGADNSEHVFVDENGYFWPESSLMFCSENGVETLKRMILSERMEESRHARYIANMPGRFGRGWNYGETCHISPEP